MNLDLDRRVYLVDDGATTLGREVARVLISEGARVVLGARGEHDLSTLVEDLGASHAVAVAPGEGQAPAHLVACAEATWGRLDGAVISAGDIREGGALEVTDAAWTDSFQNMFLRTVRAMRVLADSLPAGGSIALALSTAVYEPGTGQAVADALERGLATVALELAGELGPRGIRVNGLLAGAIDPSRLEPGAVPLGRHGSPEEFARVAAFLLSPASSYVTGTLVPVDGGMSRFN